MFRDEIRKYYDKEVLSEWRRLIKDPYHQLEYKTTLHFLKKYLPSKGLILDAGGGPGRYTIELAKQGYEVILFDLSPELQKKAQRQIRRAKVQDKVIQIMEGSITDLKVFDNNSFDVVLCLGGPIGHILEENQRDKAVNELIRVAKPNAPIYVLVIGRLAIFPTALEFFPKELELTELYLKVLETGDYEGGYGFTSTHFFLSEELEGLFQRKPVEILEMVGLEGLAATHRRKLNKLARNYPKSWKNWLQFHYKTCTHPNIVGTCEHFMLICRRS